MTTDAYISIPDHERIVRLAHRILVQVLTDRNRLDLLREYDEHGARIEGHPDGLELCVGSESVTIVTHDALRLGLRLEDANDAN